MYRATTALLNRSAFLSILKLLGSNVDHIIYAVNCAWLNISQKGENLDNTYVIYLDNIKSFPQRQETCKSAVCERKLTSVDEDNNLKTTIRYESLLFYRIRILNVTRHTFSCFFRWRWLASRRDLVCNDFVFLANLHTLALNFIPPSPKW